MKHIPFKSLYSVKHGWLQSHFHFSFAEYYDKKNMHYGVLRVMNDDTIQAHTGFATHPHRDMEIITYIIEGELTHEDSMGNKETLSRGSMQYLSAGTGITHSEYNEGDVTVHLLQIWILPREDGLLPQYGSRTFTKEARHNKWLHLIASEGASHVTTIYQDANIYVTELDMGKTLTCGVTPDRQVYVKVMEGDVNINGTEYREGDAGEIEGEDLTVLALNDAHILVVEMSKESLTYV